MKGGFFYKLNRKAAQVLKIQQEEIDAQTQMLFCLMLLNNSFHAAKLLRSRKTKHKQSQKKAFWVRSWFQRKNSISNYRCILSELRSEDQQKFREYLRISPETFEVSSMRFISLIHFKRNCFKILGGGCSVSGICNYGMKS